MRRRHVLRTVAATATVATLGGCAGLREPEGEGTTVEIIPHNDTDQTVSLDVEVYAQDGSLLLDHAYTLDPDEADESEGVPDRVGHLLLARDDEEMRHEYDPDIDIDCEGEDVQIGVLPGGLHVTYSC